MKKVLIGVLTVGLLGVGGVLVAAQLGEEPEEDLNVSEAKISGEDVNKSEDTSNGDSDNEETGGNMEEPTVDDSEEVAIERFKPLEEEVQPWGFWDISDITQFRSEGKVVYLIEDAPYLEEFLSDLAKVPDGETKESEVTRMVQHLQLFIEELVERHIEHQDYFDKLNEVKQLFIEKRYGEIPLLIEEAKTLRESE